LKKKENGKKSFMKIIKKEDVAKSINKLIEILKDLKFNNYKGEFLIDDEPYNLYECFKCSNTELIEGDECVVCYERCLHKTVCRHSICFRCIEKIPKKKRDDNVVKPCPLCRKDITPNLNYAYSDTAYLVEDEDDDEAN